MKYELEAEKNKCESNLEKIRAQGENMKKSKRKPSEKQIVKTLEECAQYFDLYCREENSFGEVGKISETAPHKRVKRLLQRLKDVN